MKLLAGNSNRPLAEAIAACLGTPLTDATVHRFADMEVFVEIHENVRGEDVFLVQSGLVGSEGVFGGHARSPNPNHADEIRRQTNGQVHGCVLERGDRNRSLREHGRLH